MEKETFRVGKLSEALEKLKVPLSPVVKAGDFVYVSGIPPFNFETGEIEQTDIKQQTKLVLEGVKTCLEAAGSSLDKVVKCTVFVSNSAYYGIVNEIYAGFFPHDPPARTFATVGSWPFEFDIEIECIAIA